MTLTSSTASLPRALALAVALALGVTGLGFATATLASDVVEASQDDGPRPAPQGLLIGTPAGVTVYTEGWHGTPAQPWRTVSGAFQLDEFPYGAPDSYSSVFFLREGCYAHHVPVLAPAPERDAAPDLGKVVLRPLLPEQAGLTVVVAADGPQDGLRAYLDRRVCVTPRDGSPSLEATTRLGEARFGLAPGKYLVYVEGARVPAREVTLQAREGASLVFTLP